MKANNKMMRQTHAIVCLLALIITLTGCTIDEPSVNAGEFPFVKEGKVWICGTQTFKMEGDTIIGIKSYKKLYRKNPEQYGDNNMHYFAAIRERDKQVYAIKPQQRKEILIYDFSLEKDDIITVKETEERIIEFEVCSEPEYLSSGRKKWEMIYLLNHQPFFIGHFYWIEGVGNLEGPFLSIDDYGCGDLYVCYEDSVSIYP